MALDATMSTCAKARICGEYALGLRPVHELSKIRLHFIPETAHTCVITNELVNSSSPVRPRYLVTYACLLAGSIGHRQWNATVFCPWPSLAPLINISVGLV